MLLYIKSEQLSITERAEAETMEMKENNRRERERNGCGVKMIS